MKINSCNLKYTKNNFIKFEQAQMHNSFVYNTDVFNAFKVPRKKSKSSQKDYSMLKNLFALTLSGVIGISLICLCKSKTSSSLDYKSALANDMTRELGKKINIEQLNSIMTPNELIEILPKFKKENYFAYNLDILKNGQIEKVFKNPNLENGIFKIDLHSHTNHSDGQASIQELLNNVVEYADKLNAKTNEKFIFSITDHDGIEGTKEALKIIAENPEKYKNLRFVAGVELTYTHLGKGNKIEISEILAHCINPYSRQMNDFIQKIPCARKNLFLNTIEKLNQKIPNVKFNINEMDGNFLNIEKDWFKYNLHWRLYNYAQIKQRITNIAQKLNKNPETFYQELMPKWHIWASNKSPETFEGFLKEQNLDSINSIKIDNTIDEICFKYFPKIVKNTIVSNSERTFDEIVKYFEKNNHGILGFAHPAFTTIKVDNPRQFYAELIQKSKGLIKTTECFHMSYDLPLKNKVITQNSIDETNKILEEFQLLNVGGHDNHSKTLI